MKMYRDPKTGRFVKSTTPGCEKLPESYRDPKTGRFVKRTPTIDADDSLRKQVSDLQNRLLKLEAQAANCVVPNWEDCIWTKDHRPSDVDDFYNIECNLPALPYPTWLLLDGGMSVKLGKEGSFRACLYYTLARDTSFLPVMVPANYWVRIELWYSAINCAKRFRCIGYTPEQEQT